MSISLDAATLISICTESVLYGIYLVCFSACIYVLMQKRKKGQGRNRLLLAISVVMFILSTMHIVTDLIRVLRAFITHEGASAGYLSAVNADLYLVKTVAYELQTIVGDGFMLYRLFWVWRGDKRVVIPIFICFLTSIGVAATIFAFFVTAPSGEAVFVFKLQRFIASFFSLTLFTNLSCTFLIAGRIWWSNKNIVSHAATIKGRTTMPAAAVVIESGAIYSIMLVLLLATYASSSYAQYFFLDAACHVIGIVFSMIIVRIGLGLNSSHVESEAISTLFIAPTRSAAPRSSLGDQPMHIDSHPMGPLEVKVTQETFRSTGAEIRDGKPLRLDFDREVAGGIAS